MANSILYIVALHFVNSIASTNCIYIEGYYWREYAGIIPKDALPGGTDYNGNPIYIGQILHENKIITSKIYANDFKAYYGLGGVEYSGTETAKILCTQHPERFTWIKIKHDEIFSLTNHHIVLGGFEPPDYVLYIGRVFSGLETLPGKVTTSKTECIGLFITSSGKEINFKTFEILTYNPYLNNTVTSDTCVTK